MKDVDPALAEEAKAIVALAFRNGPIEDLHADRSCQVAEHDRDEYAIQIRFGSKDMDRWDEPEL